MKNKNSKAARPAATLIVTNADYKRELAAGVVKDEAVEPGRHVFKRSNRIIPPYAFDRKNVKIKVSIYLDADVLDFFKTRAATPGSAGYQTLVNAALRQHMEQGAGRAGASSIDIAALAANEELIQALAARIQQRRR